MLAGTASAQIVPTLLGSGVQSDACTAPTATVVDGFVGSLYAKLLVQRNGTDTWVCTRLQPEGEPEVVGGRFVVTDPTALAGVDSDYGACDTIRSGSVGDPADPATYVPFLVGSHTDPANNTWICLQAGPIEDRLLFNGGLLTPLLQDDPTVVPDPVRTPWTAGVASADCASRPGVEHLLNLEVGGTHVWTDVWQSASIAELCARAENGANVGGVRVTVDTTGSPGIAPVLTPTSDLTPCVSGLSVFQDDQDQITIRRSQPGQNPASVCIGFGASQQSFTIGTAGTADPPSVTPVVDS